MCAIEFKENFLSVGTDMYKCGKKLFDGEDPFLLKHDDLYYIYCTTENDLPAFTEE